MTRPMPGPPEKYQLLGPMVIVWEGGNGYYYHPSLMDGKRLSDAECAAEYWRAKADLATIEAVLVSPAAMNTRVRVWHRFATHPHAFKETRA